MVNLGLKRGLGSVTAFALLLSGASLALAAPANAQPGPVRVTSIAPNEDSYLGWHEGTKNGAAVASLSWAGLSFGNGADSQILNGLVPSKAPGFEIAPDALLDTIASFQVKITSGAVFQQVPITFGETGWATLRPAAAATADVSGIDTDTALWVSSQPIGVLAANTPVPLVEIGDLLESQGNLRYSGFGLFAQPSAPAVVSSLTWDGTEYVFSPPYTPIPVDETADVAAADIRADESTYAGWHEGYKNSTPAFSITDQGLSLGNGANSQIINGLTTPLTTPDLATLLLSADVTAVSGTTFFQVPLTFGASNTFTTLRQGPGEDGFTPDSDWVSSRDIPATTVTAAIAANTAVPFGTMVAALEAQGNVKVLAFGVLAESANPAVVESIVWNGVRYNFVPKAVTPPVEPTTPPETTPTTPPVTTPTTPPVTTPPVTTPPVTTPPVTTPPVTTPTTPPVTTPTTPPVTPTVPPAVAPTVETGVPSPTVPSKPGSSFTFTVSGFTPNADVQVFMHSTPVLLGTFRSDADGVVTATVTIPADAEAGTHHIVFVDTVTGISVSSAAFTVSATAATSGAVSSTSGLARTGFDGALPALLAGLLLLAGLGIGAVRVVAARRHTA